MIIVACLGNPERKYAKTRHNIGFIIGKFIADYYSISIKKKAFSSITGVGSIKGNEVLLLFPETYMNNSGKSVQGALTFYKSTEKQLIVIHDEIELPFNICKHKVGGGHKGHNGLRSIIQHIGSPDFYRFRFGVGRPDNPHITVADYVLGNFTKEEMQSIENQKDDYIQEIESIITDLSA